ncbi:Calcineurin-interacting protein 2 [Caenorhabditis elegans]|uniref:Calcineurin-interacting protein 2 n=1 Tax=Caenorhabditis elegans TaxID=6239 RepID=CNP2_CAEEL|nr:Calcineurin-interacting protein 2 [Caenorhabditis elegans]Q9U2D6.3 RecName: Full=Calcineurin-interacting protein 2; AltName: Full=Calcineurin binding protein 2 [Caenorhabditis elegans]CAB60376.3 Calcineurin-interacting protein 2 [Caenorhabditis elegans]|eukprot:NP_496715.3 Calcineurin-interacting protein 2 [Caenorhabditis elegans]
MNRGYDSYNRSRSTSSRPLDREPYHAVSELYTKEITHTPIGPASDLPPEILDILKENPRATPQYTPPLIRHRENTWTPENYPIVRVPSAQFTDVMTELYDYHEVEKYTHRSVTPDYEPLRKEPELKEQKLPTYQVIPPTPEKNTPRHQHHSGITLSPSDSSRTLGALPKKPPMYEEYLQMQKKDENRNIPRQVSSADSQRTIRNNNELSHLRHIDSSSSSEASEPAKDLDDRERYVYTHDVYVDSTTGRPFTPGREDVREKKNCDKLKINVYFKPPHPPVEITYKLDEIEIEKNENIVVTKLRPSRSDTILSRSVSTSPSSVTDNIPKTSTSRIPSSENPKTMEHTTTSRRFPTQTSILRKEHEIVQVPLHRSQSLRQSRISEHSKRSLGKTTSTVSTERPIPIHVVEETSSIDMDVVFPKMPHHQTVTNVRVPSSRGSAISRAHSEHRRSIDRSEPRHHHRHHVHSETPELPYTRGISKTPSVREYNVKREGQRSPSRSHRSERSPSEVRIPVTTTHTRPIAKRQSPEELDYGRFADKSQQNRFPGDHQAREEDLPYTRGISKTPSNQDSRSERTPCSDIHIPYNNPEKERAYQQSERSSYRSHKSVTPSEKSLPRNSETPELHYTRGISKTPSDRVEKSRYLSRGVSTPHTPSEVHIPYNNPEKERAYQQSHRPSSPKRRPSGRTNSPNKSSSSSKARPSAAPLEEIVHIKERYERDETIRRFFPTTTAV